MQEVKIYFWWKNPGEKDKYLSFSYKLSHPALTSHLSDCSLPLLRRPRRRANWGNKMITWKVTLYLNFSIQPLKRAIVTFLSPILYDCVKISIQETFYSFESITRLTRLTTLWKGHDLALMMFPSESLWMIWFTIWKLQSLSYVLRGKYFSNNDCTIQSRTSLPHLTSGSSWGGEYIIILSPHNWKNIFP